MKSYIYSINYNGIPIYIGSTNNIKEREKSHCSNLCREYKIDLPVAWQTKEPKEIKNSNQELYKFLKINNVSKIKLNIIFELENKVIIGDKINNYSDYINIYVPKNIITRINNNLEVELYNTNEFRYIEEERIIKYCFSKGLKLFNILYPTLNNLGYNNKIEIENIKTL